MHRAAFLFSSLLTFAPPPGALNPAVTQLTIGTTICAPGWTKRVRPPAAYTEAIKREQLRAAGLPVTAMQDYEEDHWIPLELGGHPTDVRNLWPELWAQAHAKDRLETKLHAAVCAGKMPLLAAQQTIVEVWGASKSSVLWRTPT